MLVYHPNVSSSMLDIAKQGLLLLANFYFDASTTVNLQLHQCNFLIIQESVPIDRIPRVNSHRINGDDRRPWVVVTEDAAFRVSVECLVSD